MLDFDLRACTAGWSAVQGISRGSETPKLKRGFQRYRGYLGGFGNPEAQSFELGVAYLLFVGLSFVARDLGALRA
jgi:hypothetical protein